jgi:shikimate kinase
MALINNSGISIYLQAEPSFLKSRLMNHKSSRPLIAKIPDEELEEYIKELLEQRKTYYEKAAIHISAIDLNAKKIIEVINRRG